MKLKVIVILLGISSLVVAQSPYQQLADQIGVYLTAPEGIDTSACESFWFLKKGSPELDMNPLSIRDGQLTSMGRLGSQPAKSRINSRMKRNTDRHMKSKLPCGIFG